MKVEKIVCPYCNEPYSGNICFPILKITSRSREEILKVKDTVLEEGLLQKLALGMIDAIPVLIGPVDLQIVELNKLRCQNCEKVFYLNNEKEEELPCASTSDVEIITLKDM